MARKSLHLFGIVCVGLVMTAGGCISQEKYNALKMERDRFAEQLGQAQTEASAARSEADAYKNQLAMIGQSGSSKDGMILNLSNQNAELQRQIDDLNRKYSDALNRSGPSPLPPALTNELSEFARQNPDLVDFDAARGIVKFKSDVTFATGSAELTPKAKEAITRFSQILNSPSAASYELIVAGHTDNTRVVNPQTIAAGHKDNWYLSAHRAISVGQELQSHGVAAQRMGVTGYADQRPAASNSSDSSRAQNRRVEVLILPTTVRGGVAARGNAAPPRSVERPNKDSAAGMAEPAAPAYNK